MKKKRFGGDGPEQAFPAQKGVTEKPEGPGTSLCGLGGKRPAEEKCGLQSKEQTNQMRDLGHFWKQYSKRPKRLLYLNFDAHS